MSCDRHTPSPPQEAVSAGSTDELSEVVLVLAEEQQARIAERPDDAQGYLELGMLYDRNSHPALAAAAYEQAARLDADEARALYHLGRMRVLLGDESGALQAFEACVERAPEVVGAQARLGDLLLSQGKLDAAQDCFEQAQRVALDHPAGAEGLARVALARGDAAKAAGVLESYLARHGDRGHARFLLGTAYRSLGRLDEAREQLERSAGLSPAAADPWLDETTAFVAGYRGVMGRAVDLGRAGEAQQIVASLASLRREHPDDVAALEKLVAAQLQLRQTDAAMAELDDFLLRFPDHPRAWYLRALTLEAGGDLEAASEAVGRALAVQRDWVPAHELAARLSWRRNDLAAAADALEAALHFGGPKLDTLLKLARVRGLLGDAAAATALHRQAAQDFPRRVEAWVQLCTDALGRERGRSATGADLQEAQRALLQARRLAPDDERVKQLVVALDKAAASAHSPGGSRDG